MFAQYAQTLRQTSLLVMPMVALLWFFAMFVIVLVRYSRASKSSFDPAAQLPLLEDDAATATTTTITPSEAKEARNVR
jgi:cbb3-type cytochrome oxidase subunit 3